MRSCPGIFLDKTSYSLKHREEINGQFFPKERLVVETVSRVSLRNYNILDKRKHGIKSEKIKCSNVANFNCKMICSGVLKFYCT